MFPKELGLFVLLAALPSLLVVVGVYSILDLLFGLDENSWLVRGAFAFGSVVLVLVGLVIVMATFDMAFGVEFFFSPRRF